MSFQDKVGQIARAVVCRPGKNITTVDIVGGVGIPDDERAQLQHQTLCDALEKCGVAVTKLEWDPQAPSKCFVGDAAVVTDYLAVIGNFHDADQRQNAQKDVACAMAGERFLKFITPPGRLDGSDVLQLDDQFFIGLSHSTNQEGAAQLAFFLNEAGYNVAIVDGLEETGIRLASAAAWLGENRILIRSELANHFAFLGYEKIAVPYPERGAANALFVNGTVVMPAGYAEIAKEVRLLGLPVMEVNISEFEKLNGNLSRLCLLLPKAREAASGTVVLPQKKHKSKVA